MTSGGYAVERLRDYLQSLAPEARALLVAEIERGVLRGEEIAGQGLILQELRRTIRTREHEVTGIGEAARLFFTPVAPFVVDDIADHNRIGRLARAALAPIWEWIGRDLMPAEVKTLGVDINRALLDDDRAKAEQLTRTLQERAVVHVRETLGAIGGDDKARRRLAVQVGTPHAFDDLGTLVRVLAGRDVLADLGRRLPNHIRAFEREHIDAVKALLEAAVAPKISGACGASKADLLLCGLLLVIDRLAAPWQLIRIAIRAAESDDTARIAETPFAVAVNIVLGEVEFMVRELGVELKAHRPVTSLLKAIYDAMRGLRTEMDLSVDSPWNRRVVAMRTEVSNTLKAEIESTPGHVRRLLRPRPLKEVVPGSLLNAIDVSDAEMLVEFVAACRNYASELAVNEVTMRSFSELQHYLESATKLMLDGLRQAGDADRPFRQSQLDAAIRFCRIVFGADYAGLLAKAAEIAVQAPPPERKSARS